MKAMPLIVNGRPMSISPTCHSWRNRSQPTFPRRRHGKRSGWKKTLDLALDRVRSNPWFGTASFALIGLYTNPVSGWVAVLTGAAAIAVLTYGGMPALIGIGIALFATFLALERLGPLRRSLDDINDAALRIAKGDRSVRVAYPAGSARIMKLVDRFNLMAETLDVQAQQRHVASAGISHEIRTPLTILKGRLHAIEDGVIVMEAAETQRLLRQVAHVLRIVDDLDMLGKTDDGALPLTLEKVDLEQIITAAISDLDPLVARHGLHIRQATRPTMVIGDAVRLMQIVTNLVTNAAKHSHHGAEIHVSVRAHGAKAVIYVTDEGPGIADADKASLFQPFWRSAADQHRGCPGHGIGLTLTASLVRVHGGEVSVKNRDDRSGACFCVLLPLAAA